MKSLKSIFLAVGLVTAPVFAGATIPEAKAQATPPRGNPGTITCIVKSNHANAWGISYNAEVACASAMNQCRVRTPTYDVCQVVRYWVN